MAGLSPQTSEELNSSVGVLLRTFSQTRSYVHQQHNWLLAQDLKIPPYNMTSDDETLIKSAISQLDSDLQPIDMTFISRLIGLPVI